MEQFWTIFWSAVGIIITGLATLLVTVTTNWINSKIKDKKLAKMLSDMNAIFINTVMLIFQTYVEALKKDNKFTEATQIEAKEKARKIIESQLTEEMVSYIKENFGDVEEYINNRIETTIYTLKR